MAKTKPVKYIFVLGGVISGLGKGIAAASIGYLLKSAGLKVTILKLDPYLNVDPGTMNPYQRRRISMRALMHRKNLSTHYHKVCTHFKECFSRLK